MATHAHDLGNSFSAAKQRWGVAVAGITTVGGIIVAGAESDWCLRQRGAAAFYTGPTPTTIS